MIGDNIDDRVAMCIHFLRNHNASSAAIEELLLETQRLRKENKELLRILPSPCHPAARKLLRAADKKGSGGGQEHPSALSVDIHGLLQHLKKTVDAVTTSWRKASRDLEAITKQGERERLQRILADRSRIMAEWEVWRKALVVVIAQAGME